MDWFNLQKVRWNRRMNFIKKTKAQFAVPEIKNAAHLYHAYKQVVNFAMRSSNTIFI